MLASVHRTLPSVPVAARPHVVATPRSDMRPLKHVEHENNVRGARAASHPRPEHKPRPEHRAAPVASGRAAAARQSRSARM